MEGNSDEHDAQDASPDSVMGSVAGEDSLTGCYPPRKQRSPASGPRLMPGNAAPEPIRPPAVRPSVLPIRTPAHNEAASNEAASIERVIEEALMSGHWTLVACEGN